jgi:hypothetical protein
MQLAETGQRLELPLYSRQDTRTTDLLRALVTIDTS